MAEIPSREKCIELLKDFNVPANVVRHSLAVAGLAMDIAKNLKHKGIDINLPLLEAAALLHDIARGRPGDHVLEGVKILSKLGYKEVAETAKTHGLYHFPDIKPETIEQKILFYADKRVMEDKIVSVKKRFEDYKVRYPGFDEDKNRAEFEFTQRLGDELSIAEEEG
ncbi:MAG: HD domain-containing protein [Nanoarchaeota archaeon]|nr:HD domain-containing protein [Nanoarchaeota archaeon]